MLMLWRAADGKERGREREMLVRDGANIQAVLMATGHCAGLWGMAAYRQVCWVRAVGWRGCIAAGPEQGRLGHCSICTSLIPLQYCARADRSPQDATRAQVWDALCLRVVVPPPPWTGGAASTGLWQGAYRRGQALSVGSLQDRQVNLKTPFIAA